MTLRVKLEIVPFGEEEKAREIGRLDINNIGVRCGLGAYSVINLSPKHIGMHTDMVYHERSKGAWALVRQVLENLEIEGP